MSEGDQGDEAPETAPAEERPKLRLPLPGEDKPKKTRPLSERLPDAIPATLFQEAPQRSKPRIESGAGAYLKAVLALALCAGVVWFYLRTRSPPEVVAPALPTGSIFVTSNPSGAAIWLNGQRTEHVTPDELGGIPVEVATRVAVRAPGQKSFPLEATVKIPPSSKKEEVFFELKPARVLKVDSDPSGAGLSLDGKSLGATPISLPPLAIGEKATVEIEEEDHLKAKLELLVSAETATVTRVKLQRARMIDVVTEPDGALVYVDNVLRAKTPKHGLKVPEKAFKMRIEKPGFKPWTRAFHGKDKAKAIELKLKEETLLGLPLTKGERVEAQKHLGAYERARVALDRARKQLERAERVLERMIDSPEYMVTERARAQSAVDAAQSVAARAEEAFTDAQQVLDGFRGEVLARLESEALTRESRME